MFTIINDRKNIVDVVCLLIFFLLFNLDLIGQVRMKFGFNADINDPIYQKMLTAENKSLDKFFNQYKVEFLRFPGGIPVRYFFWDKPELSNQALDLLSKYLQKRGNKRGDVYEKKSDIYTLPKDIYKNFLLFCKKANLTPIIQLNTFYYAEDNQVYPIENFIKNFHNGVIKEDRWIKIKTYIQNQIKYTHTILNTVYWEFGNEDGSLYEAELYGKIVVNFASFVKELYPADKIIVELAPTQKRNGSKIDWNGPLIKYLQKNNALNSIDLFAPHFYDRPNETLDNQAEISQKITSGNVKNFNESLSSLFPDNYNPKFFITEFAPFLKAYNNQNYNTQLHALIMLNYLMKFYGTSNVVGLLLHGFTARANATFFDSSLSNIYGKYYDHLNLENKLFSYYPPQSKAIKLFYNSVGSTLINYWETTDLIILETSDNDDEPIIQILNFSNTEQNFMPTKFISSLTKKKLIANLFVLNDLSVHDWQDNPKSIFFNSDAGILVAPHSFTVVKTILE